MGGVHGSRMTVYKRSALAQARGFAATRVVRQCERNIEKESALLAEVKLDGDAETIATVEEALAELEKELHLARRHLAQAQYRG
jgi:hypothetical protein